VAALAVWEFAGLLVTYWCNAQCAFCYVHSGPDRGGEISPATAIELWRSLDSLAAAQGKRMHIHLAGGEPFRNWPRLAAIVRAAHDAGLTPLEKIETNAFWATDDNLVRARLELLDALGMEKLVVSTDVYHQEFVPFDRVRRCVEVARRVLGPGRVRVRWWDFFRRPVDLRRSSREEKQAAYAAAWQRHRDRLTGRAAERLAPLLPRFPAGRFRGDHCVEPVLRSRHVHIDGYGNIFPGVCSGIILGRAGPQSVADVWHSLARNWQQNPVVEAVVTGGSYELMRRAQPFGYQELPKGYANKCHLCTHVRQFMVERGLWPEFVGPRECYANGSTAARVDVRGSSGVRVDLTPPGPPPNVSA
jgi:organic radical activating enzyme